MFCSTNWNLVIATVAMCVSSGCGGSSLKLMDLHGKATFAGKPIVYGMIDFVPNSGAGHTGPAGSAEIIDGVYNTSRTGRGVTPGPHLVRITALESRPQPSSTDETQPTVAPAPLFSGFTLELPLDKAENDFDVPESAKGFELMNQTAPRRSGRTPPK